MNISSNTLFHFTKKRDNILSILENGFYPRLCLEENYLYAANYEYWAIPMVCFCDIPLGNIQRHMKTYGKYALGLSKDWAKRKGITPVLYSNDESLALDSLREQLYRCGINSSENAYNNDGILNALMYFSCYVKQYDGQVTINKKTRTVRFYDEREWRYVPSSIKKDENSCYILSKGEFENETLKQDINNLLKKLSLHFSINDINYVIVESEKDVLEMKRSIERIKSGKYSKIEIEILTTKILSADRITEDF